MQKPIINLHSLKKNKNHSKTPVQNLLHSSDSFHTHKYSVYFLQLDVILACVCNFLLELRCSARLAQRRLTVVMRKEQTLFVHTWLLFYHLFVKGCFFVFHSAVHSTTVSSQINIYFLVVIQSWHTLCSPAFTVVSQPRRMHWYFICCYSTRS